jgi:hypothetical protein
VIIGYPVGLKKESNHEYRSQTDTERTETEA